MRKTALYLCLALATLSVLFPPWVQVAYGANPRIPLGYAFVTTPPTPDRAHGLGIDAPRLGVQLAAVLGIGACVALLPIPRKRPPKATVSDPWSLP